MKTATADALVARKLVRAMMRWGGDWPAYVPIYKDGKELWAELDKLSAEEVAEVLDHHRRRATEALGRFAQTGRGIKRAVESACYANMIQMFLNAGADKPLLEGLPFPLPDGLLAEGADPMGMAR
jgi:hypothetical protein